jgi:cystinosin
MLFNSFLYFNPTIQQDYLALKGPPIPVVANDVAFSVHAVIITIFTIFQCFIYEV